MSDGKIKLLLLIFWTITGIISSLAGELTTGAVWIVGAGILYFLPVKHDVNKEDK